MEAWFCWQTLAVYGTTVCWFNKLTPLWWHGQHGDWRVGMVWQQRMMNGCVRLILAQQLSPSDEKLTLHAFFITSSSIRSINKRKRYGGDVCVTAAHFCVIADLNLVHFGRTVVRQ